MFDDSASSEIRLPLAAAVAERLRTRRLGRPMEAHETLGSTNERACSWARGGISEGATVLAEYQTAGRGRHGRRWNAAAGLNLTFSVVLRPDEGALPPRRRGLIALAAGAAVCDAVDSLGPAPHLKWPNDVLLGGKKCCGVLAETSTDSGGTSFVILGIGLNVNQRAFSDAEPGPTPPTSLALATGRPIERAPLLAQLLERIEARYLSLLEDGGAGVRAACEARMVAHQTPLSVRPAASGSGLRVEGTFAGLAPDGALRLRTPGGDERVVHAGDVTTR